MGIFSSLFGGSKKSDGSSDICYIEWSCISDKGTCENCNKLDGWVWLPDFKGRPKPPLGICTRSRGCRCVYTYVSTQESGAKAVAEFIRTKGGAASPDDLAKQSPKLSEIAEREQQQIADQQRKSWQQEVEGLKAQFVNQHNLATALEAIRGRTDYLASIYNAPDTKNVRTSFDFSAAPKRTEKALRDAVNSLYKSRDESSKIHASALVHAYLHAEFQLKNPHEASTTLTGIKRLASNLRTLPFMRDLVGFLYCARDVFSDEKHIEDINDLIETTFRNWKSEADQDADFQRKLKAMNTAKSPNDKHFLLNDLISYLSVRRRLQPEVKAQLMNLCRLDMALYEDFLTETNVRFEQPRQSFFQIVSSPTYFCPALPSFDELWEIFKEEGNQIELQALEGLSLRIKYRPERLFGKQPQEIDEHAVELIEVSATRIAGKLTFLDESQTPCTIEQAAIAFFRRSGATALRAELAFWQAMFALAFWEEIFADGQFPDGYNDIPTDMFSGESFFLARQDAINTKYENICRTNVWTLIDGKIRKYGTHWTRLLSGPTRGDFSYRDFLTSTSDVRTILQAISPDVFAKVVRRIAENPRDHRRGLPDLLLLRDSRVLFAEIKQPREKLSTEQIEWLRWFKEESIPATVVRVRAATAHSKEATPEALSSAAVEQPK